MTAHKLRKIGLLSIACCVLPAIATAQQANPGTPVKPSQSDQRDPPRASQPSDSRDTPRGTVRRVQRQVQASNTERGDRLNQTIAACLLDHNQAEVDLGKIAVEHAKSDKVKDFAKQMVNDHSEMVDKLQKFTGDQKPSDRRSQIEHKINQRCAEAMQKELEAKSGKDFDACYVGSQIAGHMHMLATLEVLGEETSGELQSIIKDATPVVEKHYKHAKELMEVVDTRQARRDRDEGRVEE